MTENQTRQPVFLEEGQELAGKLCEIAEYIERFQVKKDLLLKYFRLCPGKSFGKISIA